jgi:Rap1a immunity proteins
MRKATFATLFFVMLAGLPALAKDDLDGNGLLPKCEVDARAMDGQDLTWKEMAAGNYCMGLVRGVESASDDVAPPKGVTVGQMERVVLLYLQNHPEELQKDDFVLVHQALRKAFPAK